MHIWHEKLIPKLCQKHLCAMWREGLGCYKIITENKNGYRNHPAVKEFEDDPMALWYVLEKVRKQMLKQIYHPKEMPKIVSFFKDPLGPTKPWQTLKQQKEILKAKNCKCNI